MKWVRYIATGAVFVLGTALFAADGEFRGPGLHKQDIEVCIIALAVTYPRSSFFANDEVFVAEQELAKDESRFIKLIYDFLPYQSPLSSYGLDYALVHRFVADAVALRTEDAECVSKFGVEVFGGIASIRS
jgi:hypothetical protein